MDESDIILAAEALIWLALAGSIIVLRRRNGPFYVLAALSIFLALATFVILSELAIDRFYRRMGQRQRKVARVIVIQPSGCPYFAIPYRVIERDIAQIVSGFPVPEPW